MGLCRASSVFVKIMLSSVCFVQVVWKSNYCIGEWHKKFHARTHQGGHWWVENDGLSTWELLPITRLTLEGIQVGWVEGWNR